MDTMLRVAVPTGIAETQLIRALRILTLRRAGLRIEVTDGRTEMVVRRLLEAKVDMILVGKDLAKCRELSCIKIPHEEENVLIVHIGHHLALKDSLTEPELKAALSQQPFVDRFDGAAAQEAQDAYLTKRKLAPTSSGFYVQSLEGCVRAVAAGVGMAIVPKGTALEICTTQIKAIQLPGNDNRRRFYIAWRKNRSLSEPARELARILGAKTAK